MLRSGVGIFFVESKGLSLTDEECVWIEAFHADVNTELQFIRKLLQSDQVRAYLTAALDPR